MRIITGKARGIRLETLEGLNTRPTAERAKEAVFSMLAFDIEGRRVLDLFAGSGQMGLEALSRGAVSAVMVDCARAAVEIIKKNTAKTRLEGAEIVCADSMNWLEGAAKKGLSFDIVFMDPPYAEKLLPRCLEKLLRGNLLKSTSLIVCESGAQEDLFCGDEALADRFDVIKSTRYGVAYVNILKVKSRNEE
ncbi:MAG: 16S rRNA (guanine(966)-N(2))-methyltransferase RsmD [Clostridia bacterium]|nr:16S rRNA (guanine(966)-N(2))-methyltransferase RsmD [Clostridia bacterium]MBQ4326887.1 16S rRNA (guanine(966)-N(2))-methyltransferase RsmD [Clostridia bacterium]